VWYNIHKGNVPSMRVKFCNYCIIFIIFLISKGIYAKKYALVITGSSELAEPEHHEFARNTIAASRGLTNEGYVVTTLFGSKNSITERDKYKNDYQIIEEIQNEQRKKALLNLSSYEATTNNIDRYFEELQSKIKKGDKVEIFVGAHGKDSCGEVGEFISDDTQSGCNHSFIVFSKDGNFNEYPSEKIFAKLKELENLGAFPTLVLASCHSGRAKALIKKYNLKKTCIFFQTSGDSPGNLCFESDPEFLADFTSTSEYVIMRYYAAIIDSLKADSRFSKYYKNCFDKIVSWSQKHKIDFSSLNSTFWTAREHDKTYQKPSTSSLRGIPYFDNANFTSPLIAQRKIPCQDTSRIKEMLNAILKSDRATQLTELNLFFKALEEYNLSVSERQKILNEKEGNTSKILQSGQKIKATADALIGAERKLIDRKIIIKFIFLYLITYIEI